MVRRSPNEFASSRRLRRWFFSLNCLLLVPLGLVLAVFGWKTFGEFLHLGARARAIQRRIRSDVIVYDFGPLRVSIVLYQQPDTKSIEDNATSLSMPCTL